MAQPSEDEDDDTEEQPEKGRVRVARKARGPRSRRALGLVMRPAFNEAVVVRLVPPAGVVALIAVLLAGCGGGGDDRAKIEASLQHYLLGLVPGEARFPIGAGAPRVKDNGCFQLEGGSVWPNPLEVSPPSRLTRWNCVVKFGTLAIPVTVAVDDAAEVVAATQGGMLREVKPNASQPSTNSDCPPQGC